MLGNGIDDLLIAEEAGGEEEAVSAGFGTCGGFDVGLGYILDDVRIGHGGGLGRGAYSDVDPAEYGGLGESVFILSLDQIQDSLLLISPRSSPLPEY